MSDRETDEILGNFNFEHTKAIDSVDKLMNEGVSYLRYHHQSMLPEDDVKKSRADIKKYLESKFT